MPVTEIAGRFREWQGGKGDAAKLAQPFERSDAGDAALVRRRYALNRAPPIMNMLFIMC